MAPDDQFRYPHPGDMRLDAAAGGFDFGEFGHDSNENVTENSQHGAHAGVEKQSRRPQQIPIAPF